MPPLKFQTILKRIRWGGRRLGTVLNKPVGDETDYAESWEVSDHGADQSVVDGGPYDGWTLARLVKQKPRELLGRHASHTQFPLLVKFLDANDNLSLQVHPDDRLAKQFDPAENGKTEAWVILDAAPGGRLYAGLKAGVDRETLSAHLHAGTVQECLHSFEVAAGDCAFIPAGTVHAIGEGVLLAEVQQSSDITFRLYDWGRVGADGRPRELHIEQALECVDFARGPVSPVTPKPRPDLAGGAEELVACEYFTMRRYRSSEAWTIPTDDRFHVVSVLAGAGKLTCGNHAEQIALGDTRLIPAAAEDVRIAPREAMTLLEACLP